MSQRDYYEILGVENDASLQQIKEAYRKLAFQYHPDRNKGDHAALEKMKELNEAYAVLSDQEKKRRYDSLRQEYGSFAHDRFRQNYSEQDIFRGSDINQIFEEMAKAFGFRGFDEVFRESYGQGYHTFKFQRPGMFGKGFIIFRSPFGKQYQQGIPPSPGIFPRLLGKLTGYLLKRMLNIQGDRQGEDRYDVITLDARDARQGGKVSYIDRHTSKQLIVTIPANIREGQTIRLKGVGSGGIYGDNTGNLYLKVQFRKSLLQKAKDLLMKSAKIV